MKTRICGLVSLGKEDYRHKSRQQGINMVKIYKIMSRMEKKKRNTPPPPHPPVLMYRSKGRAGENKKCQIQKGIKQFFPQNVVVLWKPLPQEIVDDEIDEK